VKTDYEKIGDSYYCVYCAGKIEPEEDYDDGAHYGTDYNCTCEGSLEVARTKYEIEKLKTQLDQLISQLTKSTQIKLDKHRYDTAVKDAACKFHQTKLKK